MKEERKYDSLLENYAKLAIIIYNNINTQEINDVKESKYPYCECLYQHYKNNSLKSNAGNLFLNSIYLDEKLKLTIEEIAQELTTSKQKNRH